MPSGPSSSTGNVALKLGGNNYSTLWKRIKRHRYRYLLILPGFLFFLIFKYVPYAGLLIAFQDFNIRDGIFGSKFIGFENFRYIMGTKDFVYMVRNTLIIGFASILFYFPLPIILSVMLSEVRHIKYRSVMQSVVYMPHFLSWVVVYALTFFLLSKDVGLVNKALVHFGQEKFSFLTNSTLFYVNVTVQAIWRETGWGTILILAAICNINSELYEAAAIDGAGRFRQIINVTLPGIKPVIITLLILRLGRLADVSLEQVLLLQNPMINKVSQVFSTYAYNYGILRGLTSVGVAVDLFKSFVNVIFIFGADFIIKKTGDDGIF